MTNTWQRACLLGISLAFLVLACSPIVARAALTRPNGLDHRVNGISTRALLTEPATQLVDGDRQGAALRLARWTLPGWFLSVIAQALFLAYFWQSGTGARFRDWLRRRVHAEGLVRFGYGAAIALVAKVGSTIPDFYLYRVDRAMGIATQLTGVWLADWMIDAAVSMVAVGLILWIVLGLVERTHQWYIYTALGVLVVSVGLVYAAPYTVVPGRTPVKPLTGALATRLYAIEDRVGAEHLPIVVETRSARSPIETAVVQGLGNSQRLVLSDTLLAGETQAEIGYVVAYELALVERHDPMRRALYDALLLIAGAALAVSIADRIRFRRDDDALSRMALVGALLAVIYLFALPVDHAIARSFVSSGDRYAVALTNDPASAVRAIVRETDQRMNEVCPDILTRIYLETAPSVSSRIATINGIPSGCP
jgi:Zn-dependent protease with chaperone function